MRRVRADVVVTKDDRAGRRPQAHQGLAQLGLPVALHAGDAEDLPGPDLEGDPLHRGPAGVAGHDQVPHGEPHVAGAGRVLADPQLHVAADHERGQLRVGALRAALADHLALPDHRDPVGDGLDFLELVRDEDDGAAVRAEVAHDAEEVLGLAGGEHRGRLVQDQDAGLAHQRLDDLDPLLDADGEFLDHRVRVDVEAELLGQVPHLGPGPPPVEQAEAAGGLLAQGHVLGHGEHRDEHEVLVHHADPGGDGVFGGADRDRLAVHPDLALVGLSQPVQDVHQGRFAGPVLAQQGADLAGLDRQVNVIVGHQAAETLGDAGQLKLHGSSSFANAVGSPARARAGPGPGLLRPRAPEAPGAAGWL